MYFGNFIVKLSDGDYHASNLLIGLLNSAPENYLRTGFYQGLSLHLTGIELLQHK